MSERSFRQSENSIGHRRAATASLKVYWRDPRDISGDHRDISGQLNPIGVAEDGTPLPDADLEQVEVCSTSQSIGVTRHAFLARDVAGYGLNGSRKREVRGASLEVSSSRHTLPGRHRVQA